MAKDRREYYKEYNKTHKLIGRELTWEDEPYIL